MEAIKAETVPRSEDGWALIFTALAAVLSLGFAGIIDSIPHSNWRYYAVVSPQSFLYHFKKAALFLLCFFGVFIAAFSILGLLSNMASMLINLYCMTFMFIFSICVAFASGGMIAKALLLTAVMIFALWTGFMRSYSMLLLIAPGLAGLARARSGCKEWHIF